MLRLRGNSFRACKKQPAGKDLTQLPKNSCCRLSVIVGSVCVCVCVVWLGQIKEVLGYLNEGGAGVNGRKVCKHASRSLPRGQDGKQASQMELE